MDPSGARIYKAQVHIQGPKLKCDLISDRQGRFQAELPGGLYEIDVFSPGFQSQALHSVEVPAGQHLELPISLSILPHHEEIDVSLGSSNGASSGIGGGVTFSGDQLALFSNDEDTMRRQLAAVAGSFDENGPQIYVDGFSGGHVPPRSSILQIRFNQNPFSAQYDRQGISRVDILTKPGTNDYHGFAQVTGNNHGFNARNPFTRAQPPYHSIAVEGNLSGPISRKASFSVTGTLIDQESNSVVNAADLSGLVSLAVPSPQLSNAISARLDHQFTPTDTFTIRYEYNRASVTNGGLLPLTLPSAAYNSWTTVQTLQASNTQLVNPKFVSETRFQYIRARARQEPTDTSPTIIVQGAFNGGGNTNQAYRDNQDSYELQENLSWELGKHFLRGGVRYRLLRESNFSQANYNGQYMFGGKVAPVLDGSNDPVVDPKGYIKLERIDALEQYRRAVLGLPGGTASLFSITTGQPNAAILSGDLGLYFEDSWQIRKNLTLSLGARLETQSAIPDHFDPSPRVALTWVIQHGMSKTPLVVLRPGFALFYDRFAPRNLLQSVRQNGTLQQALYVQDALFCGQQLPTCVLQRPLDSQQTIYRVDENLRSQYDILPAITAEHTFGSHGSLSATFSPYRGVHQFLLRNANAPLPGTYNSMLPGSGTRPLAGLGNVYQYSSDGYVKGRLFSASANWYPVKHTLVTALYVSQKRFTDSSGAVAFASNSYDVRADYGRTSLVASQRIFAGFNSDLPRDFGVSSYVVARSGLPYNITTGSDINGDTIYNDRPAFGTEGGFNVAPAQGQPRIPINFGDGPAYVSLQVTFGKAFHFGSAHITDMPAAAASSSAGKTECPYELGIAVDSLNVLNHVNGGTPVGVLNSAFFGRSVSLANELGNTSNNAANRQVNLRAYFRF